MSLNFEDKRALLYNEALKLLEGGVFTQSFKRGVLSLIEDCTLELMEKEDSFFGRFLLNMKREVSLRSKAPLATSADNNGYILYINPLSLLPCNKEEIKALIKHEIYHIIFGHHRRIIELRGRYSLRAINTAMDISVNQFIKKLPSFCRRLDEIKLEYNAPLEENMPLELYVELIQKAIDKLSIDGEESSTKEDEDDYIEEIHSLWLMENKLSPDELAEIEKKATKEALKGIIPQGMERYLGDKGNKGELSWQDYLKGKLATMKSGYKKTITRKDRRQPDRLDIRGSLPKRIPKVIAAVDISGSMTDKELKSILVELYTIVNNHQGEVKVLECDSDIRRVYNIKRPIDIKKPIENKGATAFSPVFQYIKDNQLKDYFLIYFTDGKGEEELKVKTVNSHTLWVITGKEGQLSLKNYPGQIVRLKKIYENKEESTYGIKIAKELLKDWDIDTEANSIQSLRVDI